MADNPRGEILKSKSKEVDPLVSEASIFKQLIKERAHPLDLIRELLSNAGATEVGASRIDISYTKDREGHIFEIADDGCGMDHTGNLQSPGRLDKFLGLGLSGIIGIKADEFSWKGLGSKLAFQSRRVEIDTCAGGDSPSYSVRINEPWETINNNRVPKPRISEHPPEESATKIRVVGHPPHRQEQPFTFPAIKTFLQHRTFAGYTRVRGSHPEINLSVLGQTETIQFGFPEFNGIDFEQLRHDRLRFDEDSATLYVNMEPVGSKTMRVAVKGFITWNAERFDLAPANFNTGLILSVKGIPYCSLPMKDYGVTTIRTARPGENKCCLVVECDSIQDEMNIGRSGLVDSEETLRFREVVAEIFQRIESSDAYLRFRRLPETKKVERQSDILETEKRRIAETDQNWVVYEKGGSELVKLIREPQNEHEVNAVIWKLEALNALPFERFETLAYIGAAKGPDILADFQEEKGSEPQLGAVI